jgi:hypothetical protein
LGRQSRRIRERRKLEQEQSSGGPGRANPAGKQPPRAQAGRAPTRGWSWSLIGPLVVVVAAILVFGYFAFLHGNPSGTGTPPAPAAGAPIAVASQRTSSTTPVDGIPCTSEMLIYHVHAHLDIEYLGRPITVPAYVGIRDNTCLYWLHTHDASGVIHIEAPHKVAKTLGNFFDIWGQPLSRQRVATKPVPAGKSMKVWVNGKLFTGDPRSIVLTAHERITIDIGPPFPGPQPFTFPQGE